MINYKQEHPKWTPYAIILLLAVGVFCQFFTLLFVGKKVNSERIAYTSNPITGETTTGTSVESNKTTSASVTRFLLQWKLNTYSANGLNPDGTPDKGNFVAGKLVTTPFYMGSLFFTQPFGDRYAEAYTTANAKYPMNELLGPGRFSSRVESNVDINNVVEVSPGKWTADVISTQTYFNRRTKEGEAFIRHEKFDLVVTPPIVSTWEKKNEPYHPVFKEMENQRLKIDGITALPL